MGLPYDPDLFDHMVEHGVYIQVSCAHAGKLASDHLSCHLQSLAVKSFSPLRISMTKYAEHALNILLLAVSGASLEVCSRLAAVDQNITADDTDSLSRCQDIQ